jgi:uncharacterized protein YjbI with pentapeptide repeats
VASGLPECGRRGSSRSNLGRLVLVLLVIQSLFLLLAPIASAEGAEAPGNNGQQALASVQAKKLRAETAEIETDTHNSSSLWSHIATVAAPLTGVAAILAIFVSLIGFHRERRQQRDQATAARGQQLEERFASALLGLGSEREAVQAGAAVSLLTFLSEENAHFHDQVRSATLANLKVNHTTAVMKLLVRTFEEAMRVVGELRPIDLDLSHAYLKGARLDGIRLDGAQLNEVDLEEAELSGASLVSARGRKTKLTDARLTGERTNLRNAHLYEVQAYKASFAGANLNNAHMKGGDLTRANFRGARLQAAHLERARLHGARFEGANVADAYFIDADFDQISLASLARADNWRKAHLSEDTKTMVEALAQPAGVAGSGDEDETMVGED